MCSMKIFKPMMTRMPPPKISAHRPRIMPNLRPSQVPAKLQPNIIMPMEAVAAQILTFITANPTPTASASMLGGHGLHEHHAQRQLLFHRAAVPFPHFLDGFPKSFFRR